MDAAVLLLGSGDLRNILYTCYVEQDLAASSDDGTGGQTATGEGNKAGDGKKGRRLDITACDLDAGVLGMYSRRNIYSWRIQ